MATNTDGDIIIGTKLDDSEFQSGLNKMAGIAAKGAAAVAAAIGAMSVAVISLGSEFETANAKASTLFGDAQVNMSDYSSKMLSLSTKTGLAASELGTTMYDALSAGIPATDDMSEAMGFLEKNTKLAKAGFTDINTATTATAKVLNAYKMDVSETDRIHKILMQTQNKGITTVNELGSVLSQVTPTASAMNVAFEQVGAALANMTAQGTPTAQATTQLNQLFAELGKSGTASGTFTLEKVDASVIHVYVTDSRENVVEKILNVSKFINYKKPALSELSFERGSGGVGTQVNMTYKGAMWIGNFGKVSNTITAQYFYKEQGSSTWVTGVTAINPSTAANFSKTTSIRGDLAALGFDAGKNYDFKILITDKITQAEKLGILSSGIPTTAYHSDGFCVGGFYDESEGGPFQIEGKQQPIFELVGTVDIEI